MATTSKPLDLAEVEARIDRHRCNAVHRCDQDFVDLSRLIDHDAPALLALVKQTVPALDRLVNAAEDLLTEWEKPAEVTV